MRLSEQVVALPKKVCNVCSVATPDERLRYRPLLLLLQFLHCPPLLIYGKCPR